MMPLFKRTEKGQGLAQYGLTLVLVALVLIVALSFVGKQVGVVFEEILLALGGEGETALLEVTAVERFPPPFVRVEYTLMSRETVFLLVEDSQSGLAEFYEHGRGACYPAGCTHEVHAGLLAGQLSLTAYDGLPESGGGPIGDTVSLDYPES